MDSKYLVAWFFSVAVEDLKQPAGWHERTGVNTTVCALPICMILAILKLWLWEPAQSPKMSNFSFLNFIIFFF